MENVTPKKSNSGLYLFLGVIAVLLVCLIASVVCVGVYIYVRNYAVTITPTAIVYGPTTLPSPTRTSATTYTNAADHFQIDRPAGWTVSENNTFGAVVVFTSNQVETSGSNQFRANISVGTESSQGLDLAAYVRATKASIQSVVSNYQPFADRTVTLSGGLQATIISGTFTQGTFDIHNMQLITVKNGRAYIVTATGLASTWSQNQDTLETSLLSLSITN